MKKLIRILVIFFTFYFSLFISSCTQDGYEKGDGVYSLMQGDFVEAQVDASKKIVSLTTDDGVTLPLTQPYAARWITTADTLYRCMLYYNKVKIPKAVLLQRLSPSALCPVPRW